MSDIISSNIEEVRKVTQAENEANNYFGHLMNKKRAIGNPKEAARRRNLRKLKRKFGALVTNPVFLKK